ncbi:MAG: hypothetical protein OHK0013_17020 [Sandaracinaceae bacterium]
MKSRRYRTRRELLALTVATVSLTSRVRAEPSAVLTVLVFADGHVEMDGRRLDDAALEEAARAHVRAAGPERARAAIASDRSVPYERVIAVMDALRRGGLVSVSLLVQPEG